MRIGRVFSGIIVVLTMIPFLWLLYSAFLSADGFYSGQPLKISFSLENFKSLGQVNLWKPLLFSLLASSIVVTLQILTSLPAAYAIRAGTPLLGLYLFFFAIPAELMLVPLYGLLQKLHLLNSPLALIFPFMASPFMVFLLYQGMLKIPWEYVEAARLDGASESRIMFQTMLPLLLPELAAASVLAFAGHWNLVLYPKVVLSQDFPTIQVALSELMRATSNNWGVLGAAALVTSLPIILLYGVFERYVVKTFQGGLK
ncbi:ABC transporter permease [Deinococcus roseus]|uniref:ABC transporter permease n=2 Tax=Deinococcus roseus TaxID=392414 RepID=A0ABQ2DIX9_9DEIO|nr:ABC transporter permease [Deinococcus roseus]